MSNKYISFLPLMASGLYDMKQVSATNTRQSGDSCYSELADALLTDDLFSAILGTGNQN